MPRLAEILHAHLHQVRVAHTYRIRPHRSDDLVYLDPPWQGTSGARDTRYHQTLDLPRLLAQLDGLNRRAVPYLLSFDGRLGAKVYGDELPGRLALTRLELPAGRSSQATLSGRVADTVESLYLSPALLARLPRDAVQRMASAAVRRAPSAA